MCSSVNLTAEAGTIGGQPMGGLNFGTARNAEWIAPSSTLLDFYQVAATRRAAADPTPAY